MIEVLEAKAALKWRENLKSFKHVDVCHMPEYHLAYETRFKEAKALQWNFKKGSEVLSYPFLSSPVFLTEKKSGKLLATEYFDISGIYGFSGPLSTTEDKNFLKEAWSHFDSWAEEKKAVCEFIRFSVFAKNTAYAHPRCQILENRPIAMSALPADAESYLNLLPSKTRNMIRRAKRDGLVSKKLDPKVALAEFRGLYKKTMDRNEAKDFFDYDDLYYQHLFSLPGSEITLYGVYSGNELIAAAIALQYEQYAFYHLGAIDKNPAYQGAGNLVLFEMATELIRRGVKTLNVGGGRSTNNDDALFNFKKSNGTYVDQFYIGKRIIDEKGYQNLVDIWEDLNQEKVNSEQLQFYR